jgi:hypothetical protein
MNEDALVSADVLLQPLGVPFACPDEACSVLLEECPTCLGTGRVVRVGELSLRPWEEEGKQETACTLPPDEAGALREVWPGRPGTVEAAKVADELAAAQPFAAIVDRDPGRAPIGANAGWLEPPPALDANELAQAQKAAADLLAAVAAEEGGSLPLPPQPEWSIWGRREAAAQAHEPVDPEAEARVAWLRASAGVPVAAGAMLAIGAQVSFPLGPRRVSGKITAATVCWCPPALSTTTSVPMIAEQGDAVVTLQHEHVYRAEFIARAPNTTRISCIHCGQIQPEFDLDEPVDHRAPIDAFISDEGLDDEGILLADGFEEAFVGVVGGCGRPTVACYDEARCIDILARRMSHEEAAEFFSFNVSGAYVGERTPMFLRTL